MKANIIIRCYVEGGYVFKRLTIFCDDKDFLITSCNCLGTIVSMYIDDGSKKETNN